MAGRAVHGRRLALLAILTLARDRRVTRDRVIGLLWPASLPHRARPQLSDALYILRSALGEDAVRTADDVIVLNPLVVSSDVEMFERLIREERLEDAVRLRTGPLLDGFHLSDAAELEHWLDGERALLDREYATALETLATACEARGDFIGASGWWRQACTHDPYSGRLALRLMRALERTGDRAAALRHAGVHVAMLREEFDAGPDAELAAFVEALRRARPEPIVTAPPIPPPTPSAVLPPPDDDITTSAMSAEDPIVRPTPARRGARARTVPAAAVVMLIGVVLIGVAAVLRGGAPTRSGTITTRTIGVLPFANMGSEPGDLYFSDGLTEQIITVLSRIEGLRIAARTSSFALRDRAMDVRAIGEAPGVGAVLEGSVRRDVNRLRVSAQLIDAETGYHLWSGEYDRELRDVLAVQDEIARAIAVALRLHLADDPAGRSPTGLVDIHAYDLYLRGLLLRNGLTGDALRQAASYFDSAVAVDPGFALAYAGKATIIGPLITFGHVSREEGLAEFNALTLRALELDPTLGEAHTALGLLRLFFLWDFEAAGTSLRHAVELNPSDAHARHHYANWLRMMGRMDEAVTERRHAVALDPLNARTHLLLGSDLVVAGDPEAALPALERGVALDPVQPLALGEGPWLPATPGEALRMLGRHREAVEDYVRVAGQRGASATEVDALRRGFATDGMPGFWRSWIAMDTRQSGGRPDALRAATLWALAGDTAQAFEWLDLAYRERNPGLINLREEPAFASLRSHPRFERIVDGMHFPPGP